MSVPFMTAASLATVVGATQDSENRTADDAPSPSNRNGNMDKKNKRIDNPQEKAPDGDNDDSSTGGNDETSIRTIRSIDLDSSSRTNLMTSHHAFLRTSRVDLSSAQQDTDEEINHLTSNCNSFIEGSFHSGLMARISIPDGCFAIAAGPVSSGLMAVGTLGAIQLYSVTTHVLVATIPLATGRSPTSSKFSTHRDSMVSALAWLDRVVDKYDDEEGYYTLVAATLSGHVSVYHVDPELLEVEGGGIQALPGASWALDTQVRSVCVTTIRTTFSFIHGGVTQTAVAAVGDAEGCLHLFSWPTGRAGIHVDNSAEAEAEATSFTHAFLPLSTTAILQVAWDESANHIAISTQTGEVSVYRFEVPREESGTATTIATTGIVWSTQRAGPVRALAWQGNILAFGGYDKRCVLVDLHVRGVMHEIVLEGTINDLSFDPLRRYLAVGCRDKSLTLLDTSTWQPIKSWGTTGWVTSITWFAANRMVLRSERTRLSVLDLTPTQYSMTDRHLFATPVSSSNSHVAVTWLDAERVVRTVNNTLVVADTTSAEMDTLTSWSTPSPVQRMALDPGSSGSRLATVDTVGRLSLWETQDGRLTQTILVEEGLRALGWSSSGKLLATGGKNKVLHIWNACKEGSFERATDKPLDMSGRVWDLAFSPIDDLLAVALGDYTTILLDTSTWQRTLQITRTRTVRCCSFHPRQPLVVVGDGAGTVCIVDYDEGDILHDFDTGNRVNTVLYSPQGDYLIVGSDEAQFTMHHVSSYQRVQEFQSNGFATTAAFSPGGTYLALGCSDASYGLVRLGPFLGIDLVPLTLQGGISELPSWALAEVLYRSGDGPSFVQRHMMKGGPDNLRRVSSILQHYAGAVYTYNRKTGDTFFHTALHLKKPHLLKLVVTAMVDGTLDRIDERSSVLTTSYPRLGRQALEEILDNYSAELVGDIFQEMTFLKVPFAEQRSGDSRNERASNDFCDPWSKRKKLQDWHKVNKEDLVDPNVTKSTSLAPKESLHVPGEPLLTPAVLPLPGLGEMDFLLALLSQSRADIWDNEAMALVLRVMWKDHLRKFFIVDFAVYLVFCACWVLHLEAELASSSLPDLTDTGMETLEYVIFLLNSLFALKEVLQARYGRRPGYFRSFWNGVDIFAVVFVYAYILYQHFNGNGNASVPLAVVSTLMSTMKLLSYLRGFGQTGWLIAVLGANFWDIRGFLVILFTILVGFAVAFRLLFASVSDEAFGSLRRSFLSTFELAIVGSYEADLLYNSQESALAIFTFLLAVTCCFVVTLNALISLLSDSYARIMENATANRRKERAGLIVEYMSLLPPSQRRSIEAQTQWFHTLLEADSDGELKVNRDDWEGGLNALRKDMADLDAANRRNQEKLLHQLKTDVESELVSFRKEVVHILEDLQDQVKEMKLDQKHGGIAFRGKGVKKVVKAVRSFGKQTALFAREPDA